MSETRVAQIIVAGVGNAWLRDDGFGGEVAKRLAERDLPDGVHVFDFGTGGLNLAYEVMRGYDGLILVDVSRQGEEPGTLYVMEPNEEDIEKGIEDGEPLDPHAMDPQTVLRFIRTVGGWPGKVVIIACEPEDVEQPGIGLSDAVEQAVDAAVDLVLDTARTLAIETLAAHAEAQETAERGAAAAKADAEAARRRIEEQRAGAGT